MFFDYLLINIIILILLNLIFFSNLDKLSLFLNIQDIPDLKRKIHTHSIPKIGGIILFAIIFFFYLILFFFQKIELDLFLIIPLILVFITGCLDDKYDLNPILKLFILLIFFYLFLFLNPEFIIRELKFNSFTFVLNLKFLAIPFTLLCFLLLINSINMIDGINSLCAAVQLAIILLLFVMPVTENLNFREYLITHQNIISFNLVYIICLFFFIIKNFQNKLFLGDGGAYFGSIILIVNIVYFYKNSIYLKSDQIFLLLCLPGIDMFRVFLVRIFNKKNPFKADKIHLHHLLLKRFSHVQIVIILILLILIPNIISIFFKNLTFESFIIFILLYLFLVLKLNKKNV